MPLSKTNKNNKIKQAYKFRMYPNNTQCVLFAKTFGCCRKYYNLALDDEQIEYKNSGKHIIKTPAFYKKDYLYFKDIDSLALANEQLRLNQAFKSFFDKVSGYPKYKSKNDKQSYTTNVVNNNICLIKKNDIDYIKLPKIGLVKIKLHRKTKGTLKSVTVTKEKSGRYFISLLFEQEEIKSCFDKTKIDALDYKSDGLYVDLNGNCDMPKFYKTSQARLKTYQKDLSKKRKCSNNYKKQKIKLAKFNEHIKNQRLDFLHKQSTKITNLYDVVVVENLDLKKISSSKSKYHLGKATTDNGYGMFINMLDYKLKNKGGILIKADKFYPSSQICSCCGYQNKEIKDLSVRSWTCPCCGTNHDRDENAVKNLLNYGIKYLDT